MTAEIVAAVLIYLGACEMVPAHRIPMPSESQCIALARQLTVDVIVGTGTSQATCELVAEDRQEPERTLYCAGHDGWP